MEVSHHIHPGIFWEGVLGRAFQIEKINTVNH